MRQRNGALGGMASMGFLVAGCGGGGGGGYSGLGVVLLLSVVVQMLM